MGLPGADSLLDALRLLTHHADAEFRDGQRNIIEALVWDRRRLLDDIVNSSWTLIEVGRLLGRAGVPRV